MQPQVGVAAFLPHGAWRETGFYSKGIAAAVPEDNHQRFTNPFGFIFLTNAPHKPVEMHEIGNIGKVMLSTRQENAHWAMRVRS